MADTKGEGYAPQCRRATIIHWPRRLPSFSAHRIAGAAHVKISRFAVVLALVAASCSGSSGDGRVVILSADETGPDPFTEDFAGELPVAFTALEDVLTDAADQAATIESVLQGASDGGAEIDPIAARQARLNAVISAANSAGLSVIAPESPLGVGLFGGSGVNACDVTGLKGFFAANPDKAEAFAQVHSLEVHLIDSYLDLLTPGFLLADTPILNHGFRDGEPYAINAILEAGTAVLVDSQGIPRVRCKCGNPLLTPLAMVDGTALDASAFADRVVTAHIGELVPDFDDEGDWGVFTNNPRDALGTPDKRALSLGDDPFASSATCRFQVLVEFVDNRLVDGEGADLAIIELGLEESSYVFVGTSADDLRLVGEVSGGANSLDISAVASPGELFTHVQVCDGPESTSSLPGSDIDAIAALHSVPAS